MSGSVRMLLCCAVALLAGIIVERAAFAEFKATTPQPLPAGAVAVEGPGNYDKAGTTYVLTKDVSGPATPIFLGKDVTLDLNGHTVTYADAKYEHVPNGGFEDGSMKGWDVSEAPGAKIDETEKTVPFVGKYLCRLPEGQEIVSQYIELPMAGRSYYAMCGVTSHQRIVEISVEDAEGKPVTCEFLFGNNVRRSCPQKGSPKLGGGFVFAHLHGLAAGKYRIRVKAIKGECLVDEIDIRPALDAGVAVVDKTYPWAYYKCIMDGDYAAFFDYTKKGSTSEPVDTVPRVTGPGTITIRNGVIRSGVKGVRSWGIQSTANDVKIVLQNVKIVAQGINTNAVDIPVAEISDCRFEIDTPFIIDRHRLGDMAANLRGPKPSTVTNCEFIGGQGCLNLGGPGSVAHDNLFVNKQTVTNHYSIAVHTSNVKIFKNRFEPEIGSGIELFGSANCEVYENVFKIAAAPPNCEYRYSDYSTNAIRITDYNRKPGAPGACGENFIRDNRFFIVGKDYPQYDRHIPMAYGIFQSVGGGTTHVVNNTFVVDYQGENKGGIARAVYIGGSDMGGEYVGNTITTNVPAFWIASRYGEASNAMIARNTIIKAEGAKPFAPFELGWWKHVAKSVQLRSNVLQGLDFDVFLNTYSGDGKSTFKVFWTLTVKAPAGTEIVILDKDGKQAFAGKTGADGSVSTELLEFSAVGKDRTHSSPYTVKAGGQSKEVKLDRNTEVTMGQ